MTRASATRRTLLLCLVTTVLACRTTQVESERGLPCDQAQWRRLSAERSSNTQSELERQLASIEPKKDSLATGTPIIDIHTHTFNARYLPLRNILLGKRDAKPPLTWLLSDSCAEALAQAVIDRTELAPISNQDGAKRVAGPQPHIRHGPVCNILLKLLDNAAMAGAWREDMPLEEQKRQLDAVADRMQPQERLMIRTAGAMMGMEKALETPDKKSGDRSLVRFLWMITQNDARMRELYRSDYSGAAMRGEPLMVSHMMDLPPVYAQDEDGATLLRFSDQQLERVQYFQQQADSGMIYFVAYNPYRDHWPVHRPDESLRVVQDAVREHGAWGMKFYPPSGYRPAANKIPSRPCGVQSRWPKIEYDARYAGLGADQSSRDAELNRRVDELLTWCIRDDIAVFVHSGTGEFEAQKGYGLSNSNPSFWREFLESHPGKNDQGKEIPCPLRLCMGHAGGADFWFGAGKYPDWGREAYELFREFPNVYCEITTHAELTYPDKQARF